jgi:hypothetical protein
MVWVWNAKTAQVVPTHPIREVELKASDRNPGYLRERYLLFDERLHFIEIVTDVKYERLPRCNQKSGPTRFWRKFLAVTSE